MPGGEWRRLPVIVLAAGRGKRMGGPKILMKVDGIRWQAHQQSALYNARLAPVWVVSPEVRKVIGPEFMRTKGVAQALVDADPDAPMFESLRAGLRFLEEMDPPGIFVLPIDVPAPGADVWRTLAGAGGLAAAPAHEGRHGHPVYLDWSFAKDHVLSAPPGARLDTIIAPVVRHIPVSDARITLNLNTPELVRAYEHEFLARGEEA
jgi:nicotine blue oxidoreductase